MAEYKVLHGILALIDIVNFTPQATKLGGKNTQKYTTYFQDKVTAAAGKHGFQVIKSMGDAVLIFGLDAEAFLEIMADLFEREKLEDRFGFKSQYRMVGHSGFFQFQMKEGRPVDLVSPEGIKLFRMEKIAHSWELVVTPVLYQGILSLLTPKNLEASRLELKEPLKGFDNKDWEPVFYKLRIARGQERVSNLLEPRLERLEQEVQEIPVFGNIYPPVPMENNFINLSLVFGETYEGFRRIADGGSSPRKGRIAQGIPTGIDEFNEKLLRGAPRRGGPINGGGFLEKRPPMLTEITVSELYEHFRSGVILGLPGAGKTTILRYLAYREFRANKINAGERRQVVLFVPCRDVPFYDSWFKKRFAVEPSVPTIGEVLEFMTWVFLEGKSDPGDLTPARWVEFQETGKRVKQAFREGRVWLLVDALDEAGGIETRERIKQLFVILFEHLGENRLFLTSRPLERIHLDQAFRTCRVPVFKVVSLTMEQVRSVAKHIMAEDSAVYKKFDTAVWQEEVVIKMAATPITALLIVAYFQAYEKFDHRFPMYDLLMKFILLKVWDNIKTGAFPFGNLELFFQEVKDPGFFNKHKETRILYDALASLCYQLFYESADGTVQRSVNEDTLLGHFSRFIRDRLYYYDEEMARAEAMQWRERFRRDYLLLQAGKQEYVFVHSTVMEFLAAYYLVEKMLRDKDSLADMVKTCAGRDSFLDLETVPIAAGHSLLAGYAILAVLRDLVKDIAYDRENFYRLAVKCLAEVEWLLHKTLKALQLRSLEKPVMDIVRGNYLSVHWIYLYLKELVSSPGKEKLAQAKERFELQLRLSRPVLLEEYLDYGALQEGDSQLVELRRGLLAKLVQKEPLEQWLMAHKEKEERLFPGEGPMVENLSMKVEQVLDLDSRGYHPEDKNFGYYKDLIGPELVGFFGSPNMKHSAEVCACAFAPDGRTFVSASNDGTLKLWNTISGKEIRAFKGHRIAVWSCALSPDGTLLVSGSRDHTLKLWDAASGKEIHTFTGHQVGVPSCAFSPGGVLLVSASKDLSLRLWEVASGKEISTFTGHKNFVWGCAFSPDGTLLASASYDHTLKLWEVASGKEISTFIGHQDRVYSCAFSPDGTHLVSASKDYTLKLWEIKSGKAILTFTGHKNTVNSCAFSPDGTLLVSASWDSTLKLWEVVGVKSVKEIRTFAGHKSAVFGCAFSPDGILLASASADYTLKMWESSSGKEIRAFTGHTYAVVSCTFSPDGTLLVSASSDQTLKLWDAASGKEMRTLTGHKNTVRGCAFSPDGACLVSASDDQTLKLWDAASGKEMRTLTGHKDPVMGCAYSPDGTRLVSASSDQTLKLWDAASGKEMRTLTGHQASVWGCAFSPDGTRLVSASDDQTLKLWDAASGQCLKTLQLPWIPLFAALSPLRPHQVVTANANGTLTLFDFKEIPARDVSKSPKM